MKLVPYHEKHDPLYVSGSPGVWSYTSRLYLRPDFQLDNESK